MTHIHRYIQCGYLDQRLSKYISTDTEAVDKNWSVDRVLVEKIYSLASYYLVGKYEG